MNQLMLLVTVNILTWNRKADLERLLVRLMEQSYPNLEVIVVDNASTDGTSEMVEGKFPWVRLFKLSQNRGVGSWNVGFENATGEYTLVLDDDCFPEEDAITKMVDKFRQEPDTGIVAFRILDLETGKYWNSLYTPATDRELDWFTFAGCAAGFRTRLIKDILFPDVFLYEHELEPSIRILDLGYKIRLCPQIRAYHRLPKSRRQSWKGAYFGTRNDLMFAWKCFPSLTSLRLTLGIIVVHGFVALKHRRLIAYLRGIFGAIKHLRATIRNRKVVGEYALRAFSPFLDSKKVFSGIRKDARTGLIAGL
jgi:GT2 family glycosyltransferase